MLRPYARGRPYVVTHETSIQIRVIGVIRGLRTLGFAELNPTYRIAGFIMTKADIYRDTLETLPDWEAYLLAESGLPGPRGNLELAAAVVTRLTPVTTDSLSPLTRPVIVAESVGKAAP